MRIDLHHLVRSLRRSPVSAAAAVVTLSLTIGAGASIFAVVDAVLLTPPPFADPDALVTLGETPIADLSAAPRAVRYGTFEVWRERAGSRAALEAYDGTNFTLTELGAAERVSGNDVTPGFLALLGVTPVLGRGFDANDSGQAVVIISHAFWRQKFAADPAVLGRQIMLGGRVHTIVGVLPEPFVFAPNICDIWRPLPVTAAEAARTGYRVSVVARLAPAVSPEDVTAMLDDAGRAASPPMRAVVTRLTDAIAGDAAKMLGLLAGAAALATIIAFANLAGLLMVRSIDRRRELAVRTALGARRLEIVRQLLLEAQALVAAGIAGGVLLALWMTPVVGRLALEQFGGLATLDVAVSWRVIVVVSMMASACAAMCGLLPAVTAARRSVVDVLRRGVTPAPRERTLRRAFVAGEVALAFVLLVSVTLLGRSLFGVLGVSPGLEARGVMLLQVSLPAARYPNAEGVVRFYSALQRALEQRLGPGAASMIDEAPLTGDRGRSVVSRDPADAGREAVVRAAGTGYFDVMRIPIVAGRPFDANDTVSAPSRAVVSASLAEGLFGSESPIGRRVSLSAIGQTMEIVGVAGDVKHRALDEPRVPTVYLAASQAPSHSNIVVIRSARPNADVIAAVRDEVIRLDRDVPVYRTRSMPDVVGASPGVPARRVLTAAFTGFAGLAVILGALGLFGVAAHDVASRRGELALRLALGANPRRILRAILGQGVWIVGAGLLAGGVLSMWAARVLGGLVAGTGGVDVLSAGVATAVLVAVAAAAVLPAALRAAHTDPLIALRGE